jgi:adenylyl- and sulfurtransferase ThiI
VKQSQILIRYGEIGLKAENTRRHFANQLKKNIKQAFSQEKIPLKLVIKRGRFFLHTNEIAKASKVLEKIFGIVSFSPVWESSATLSVLTKDVIQVISTRLTSETSFALRVRRSGTHEYTSQDVAVHVGQVLCNKFSSPVDLENPEVELFIEIRDQQAFLFLEKIKGVGGMPYATQGMVCSIIEKPIDLLASWFLMKRGCKLHMIVTTESLLDCTKEFLETWYVKDNSKIFFKEDLSFLQALNQEVNIVDCNAVCTGINCFKNEKLCLKIIKQIQKNCSLPVLTPLISMNERELEKRAKQVGIKQ